LARGQLARSVCRRAGALDTSLRIYPDLEYGYRVIGAGRVLFADRVVFRYRLHTTNITRDRLGGRATDLRPWHRRQHRIALTALQGITDKHWVRDRYSTIDLGDELEQE
jgi:hypothetical protein